MILKKNDFLDDKILSSDEHITLGQLLPWIIHK